MLSPELLLYRTTARIHYSPHLEKSCIAALHFSYRRFSRSLHGRRDSNMWLNWMQKPHFILLILLRCGELFNTRSYIKDKGFPSASFVLSSKTMTVCSFACSS